MDPSSTPPVSMTTPAIGADGSPELSMHLNPHFITPGVSAGLNGLIVRISMP